jgi:hypothetical protein
MKLAAGRLESVTQPAQFVIIGAHKAVSTVLAESLQRAQRVCRRVEGTHHCRDSDCLTRLKGLVLLVENSRGSVLLAGRYILRPIIGNDKPVIGSGLRRALRDFQETVIRRWESLIERDLGARLEAWA